MKYQKKLLWQIPLFTLAVVLVFFTTSTAQAVSRVAEKALEATVYLEMQKKDGKINLGSGFFVRHNLIATNYHVIEGAVRGTVKLIGKDGVYTLEGVTATDPTNDLALLQVDDDVPLHLMHDIKPLSLRDSDTVRIGEPVFVVGNPLRQKGTVSDGIISARRDRDTGERFQMTAPISPGSSGGPVLDHKGNVIGVSVSTLRHPKAQNLNFAIPSNYLQILLTHSGIATPFSPENQPISPEAYQLWGALKDAMRDYEGAIVYFDAAIELNPDDAGTYINRGNAKAMLGQHTAAIIDFNTAIRLQPNDAEAYVNRGNAKADLGQYFAAIVDYNTAIRLYLDFARFSYHSLIIVKAMLGQHAAPIADYDPAILFKSAIVDTYINRGNAKANLERYIAAIIDFNAAIRLQPNNAEAYVNRGLAKANLGRYFAAIADYDIAIHFKPDNADIYIKRGLVKAELGEHFAAITDYDTAIRLKPDATLAYYNRGNAKANLGRYFDAIADYDTAIHFEPEDAEICIKRGLAKANLGQYFDAITDYNAAIRLKPDAGLAYYNRGLAKGSLGSLWEAKQDLGIALKFVNNESLKAKIEELFQKWD